MCRISFLLPRMSALIGVAAGLAASACAADYAKQAREAVAAPFKVAVSQMGQGQKAGQPIDVNLQLQNGKSQPSPASKYRRSEQDTATYVVALSGFISPDRSWSYRC